MQQNSTAIVFNILVVSTTDCHFHTTFDHNTIVTDADQGTIETAGVAGDIAYLKAAAAVNAKFWIDKVSAFTPIDAFKIVKGVSRLRHL